MNTVRKFVWLATGLILVLAGACASARADDGAKEAGRAIRVSGSTTVGPIAEGFAKALNDELDEVRFVVRRTGTGEGLSDLVAGKADIALMSRFMRPAELKAALARHVSPVFHLVAMDGVAVIVHPDNPADGLTHRQVRDIYAGRIDNWKALGGPDRPIVRLGRTKDSGTFASFKKLVMDKTDFAEEGAALETTAALRTRVAKTPGAIAYVGLGFVDKTVKALAIDGVAPKSRNVLWGRYGLSRPLFMVTDGCPPLGSPMFRFVTFAHTEKGQSIVFDKGFVPLTEY